VTGDSTESRNPWLWIPASDYEGHMGPEGVDQLSLLSRIFGETVRRFRPRCLLVLGCATGNGLEHVDPSLTTRLVAVDINRGYLAIARQRFPNLAPVAEWVCAPAEHCAFEAGSVDLVHAALFFEYLDPGRLLRPVASWLAPGGILSAVLQLPDERQGVVSETRFSALRALEEVMRLVPPDALEHLARQAGLEAVESREVASSRGKRFFVGLYRKGGAGRSPCLKGSGQ
jgi:SAM-dependent methyltransferase